MRPDLIIFDCDGVLVDTEAVANQVMSVVLRRFGFDITAEQCRLRFVGRSIEAIQVEIETESGRLFGPNWPALLRAETEHSFDRGVEPIRGVRAAMEEILRVDVKYCVASSGRLSKMRKSLGLAGLLSYFEHALFSAEQVGRGKPAPDLFLFAAERMGVTPSKCVVIEDSVPGVHAGIAAGMPVLAYAGDPLSDRAGLISAGASIFHDMSELPKLLELEGAGRTPV